GEPSGQHGAQQGMAPVELHVERSLAVDPREDLVDGCADGDAAHGVPPQLEQGIVDSDDLFRATIERGVDDSQDPAGEGGVAVDDLRDLPDGRLLASTGLDEL